MNYLQTDRNELLLDPRHLGVQSGASKMIFEPVVRLAQTMHLSCIEINTIFKWTEVSFYLTHVTLDYHQLCPKWFSKLWYVRCKPCTYLALRLTLSLNRLKWSSNWFTPPRSNIWCPEKISMPVVYSTQTVHLSCIEISTISKRSKMSFHLTNVIEKYHRVCLKSFPCLWYIRCQS
jgi:hypothetical protein